MVTHPKGKVPNKKGQGFSMPSFSATMSKAKMSQNGRLANLAIANTQSGDQRILANTKCLREIYEFLEASVKRVPR